MTGSHRDDPVLAGFERRMAAIEALIPEAPAWRAPDEATSRLTVVAGSARRRRERGERPARHGFAVLPLGAAAAVAVALVAVALMLVSPASGPAQPPPLPTASPLASPAASAGFSVPPSLRGDTLLVQDTVAGNTDLYLMPLDGSPRVRLTTDPGPDREGTWTPDGAAIVYVSGTDGQRRLRLIAMDGSGVQPLVPEASEVAGFDPYSPDVSPDGRSVTFIRRLPAERWELWVVGIDGSGARRLVGPDHLWIADPTWSPDGRLIYLLVDNSTGGRIEINRLDVETGELVRLDACSDDDSGFALSPDGTRIVYESDCGGGLWLADADLTNARHWYGALDKGYPVDWSPDGRWIAYNPPFELQLLDTTVTDPTPIPLEPAERPRWRPRPAP